MRVRLQDRSQGPHAHLPQFTRTRLSCPPDCGPIRLGRGTARALSASVWLPKPCPHCPPGRLGVSPVCVLSADSTANKGRAIRHLQHTFNITSAQTKVFGDFLNAAQMICAGHRAAGVSGDQPVQVGDERRAQGGARIPHPVTEALPQQRRGVHRWFAEHPQVKQHLTGGVDRPGVMPKPNTIGLLTLPACGHDLLQQCAPRGWRRRGGSARHCSHPGVLGGAGVPSLGVGLADSRGTAGVIEASFPPASASAVR